MYMYTSMKKGIIKDFSLEMKIFPDHLMHSEGIVCRATESQILNGSISKCSVENGFIIASDISLTI